MDISFGNKKLRLNIFNSNGPNICCFSVDTIPSSHSNLLEGNLGCEPTISFNPLVAPCIDSSLLDSSPQPLDPPIHDLIIGPLLDAPPPLPLGAFHSFSYGYRSLDFTLLGFSYIFHPLIILCCVVLLCLTFPFDL